MANPINDMYADAIVAAILQAEMLDTPMKHTSSNAKIDRAHFKECTVDMLQDMFGEGSVSKVTKGECLDVTINEKKAEVNLTTLEVTCEEDETFQQIVHTAVTKLYQALAPPQIETATN